MIKKLISLSGILTAILISCSDHHLAARKAAGDHVSIDLDSIGRRGKLIAVTDFNSTNYFIYKGEPMGFHYELLRSFSDQIGVDVEIVVENDQKNAVEMLNSGEADLIAMQLDTASSFGKNIKFTKPVNETKLVLVQRKPHNWRLLNNKELNKQLARSPLDLAGKTVYMQQGSSDIERVEVLQSEIEDSIKVIEVPFDPEQLILNVASGEIEYTICNEDIAVINAKYHPDIDVSTSISLPRGLAWAVRKNHSDSLLHEVNRWLNSYRKTESYSLLYTKYFNNSHSKRIISSDYYASNTGKISPYDDLIRRFSAAIKWDWRLLASLIFQESRFDAKVTSASGAYGLMQIMPLTGKNFGIDITASPENNLKAGILYIKWLYSIFDQKILDEDERLNFILASYNAGPGHVLDAMKLAEKNGMNAQKWSGNVEVWLKRKSEPKYYKDTVVKNGYFRGIESVNFVTDVRHRFEQYKNIIPTEKQTPF